MGYFFYFSWRISLTCGNPINSSWSNIPWQAGTGGIPLDSNTNDTRWPQGWTSDGNLSPRFSHEKLGIPRQIMFHYHEAIDAIGCLQRLGEVTSLGTEAERSHKQRGSFRGGSDCPEASPLETGNQLP